LKGKKPWPTTKHEWALVYNKVALCQDIELVVIWVKRLVFTKSYDLTAKVAKVSQRTR